MITSAYLATEVMDGATIVGSNDPQPGRQCLEVVYGVSMNASPWVT